MRVKTIAVASVLVAGLSALAEAADVTVPVPVSREPGEIAAPDRNWTGIYLGVLLGYSIGQFDIDPGPSADADGADGGIFAGYNYQFNHWVTGIEADVLLSDVEASDAGNNLKQEWSSSLRLRAGYSLESFLLYGTGGIAVSGTVASSGGARDKETQLGWTVGAGIESMISDSVTARVEYRYAGYEDKVFSLGAPTRGDLSTNSLRAGVGVKF